MRLLSCSYKLTVKVGGICCRLPRPAFGEESVQSRTSENQRPSIHRRHDLPESAIFIKERQSHLAGSGQVGPATNRPALCMQMPHQPVIADDRQAPSFPIHFPRHVQQLLLP